ncbi:hypothetical protein JCM30760_21810 [Thiomicrorhabdus hydrogeniphila]
MASILENPQLSSLLDTHNRSNKKLPGLVDSGSTPTFNTQQSAPQSNTTQNANDTDYSASKQASMAALQMSSIERSYQYSETMSLQLTTKEGDTVNVDFKQLYAQYQSYQQMQSAQSNENSPSGVRYFESKQAMESTQFKEQFGFAVTGDLNDDELEAIYDVFEQVDSLASQFFDGNIEQALQQAVELEIDYGQLDSLSLNLTQTESQSTRYQQAALAEYSGVQQQTEAENTSDVAEEYGVNMGDLPAYLQQWQDTITKLNEQFENAQETLDELMGEVTAQRFPEQDNKMGWIERVKAFHEQLSQMAQNTDEPPANADITEPVTANQEPSEELNE